MGGGADNSKQGCGAGDAYVANQRRGGGRLKAGGGVQGFVVVWVAGVRDFHNERQYLHA